MPHQVVWPKCNVFNEDGEPTTLKRGELLPDGVDDTQLEMLNIVGAVQVVEFAPEGYRPENPANDPVLNPDNDPPELQKPSPSDAKDVWVSYATDERNPDRISRSDANSMSKQALVSRFSD